jgi:hypothetical protein
VEDLEPEYKQFRVGGQEDNDEAEQQLERENLQQTSTHGRCGSRWAGQNLQVADAILNAAIVQIQGML